MTKPKPWRTSVGFTIGLLIGALLWWNAYDPSQGIFQNVGLLVTSAAFAILIVDIRNRRKKVGHYDPEVIAENRRGRV